METVETRFIKVLDNVDNCDTLNSTELSYNKKSFEEKLKNITARVLHTDF